MLIAIVLAACQQSVAPQVTVEAARAELVDVISDVTSASSYRYRVTDDQGRWMGPSKIIWIPEAATFASAYFTQSDADGQFYLQLATSTDLMNWTWVAELADRASQPAIAASSDGGYVLAWEEEPDPIHIVLAYFATWDDLLAGLPDKRFDVPITVPACGEGTPSIEAASSKRVDLGFHYHGDCERDRQASGSTDWTMWSSSPRPALDQALINLGVNGHIGDRDTIKFRGHDLMLVEGQRVLDDWSSWRTFLYDADSEVAEEVPFRTHAGSISFANPAIAQIELDGRLAILMSLGIFTEGSRSDEDGGLIYYRYL